MVEGFAKGLLCMQATSYLVAAWEALATHEKTMPVVFEDVSIVQAVQAQPGENVTLSVLLDRSHRFQVPTTGPPTEHSQSAALCASTVTPLLGAGFYASLSPLTLTCKEPI